MNWANFNFWVHKTIWFGWAIFWVIIMLQISFSKACPDDKVLWLILASWGFMYVTLHHSEGLK